MSAGVWATLAWLVPVMMLGFAFLLVLYAVLVDGARRDRRQAAIYRAEAARRALGRALQPDPELRRHLNKWS